MSTADPQKLIDVRAALKTAMDKLSEANVPSHILAAELLLIHTLGRDRAWLYTHPEEILPAADLNRFMMLVNRRAAGEPTQHLTGKQEFWGLEFEVTPDVLIPRPETEHVIEVALERLGQKEKTHPLRIADVGTGSGCLAVALAREFPQAEIFATDISAPALEVARRNAARHNVSGRIQFIECNLLDAFLSAWPDSAGARFDLIVSNPPYIARRETASLPREVRDHEPAIALFPGETGTELYAPLIHQAEKLLDAGGTLVLELGYDSLDRVSSLLDAARGWIHVSATQDLAGIPRVIAAERE